VAAAEVDVPPGSALALFTDGVFEIVDQRGEQWGLDRIEPLLPAAVGKGGPRALYDHVRAAARPGPMDDDFSVLVARFS
jgi:serine phosphatase RsbU (regulator of sigma subunit)